LLLANSGQANLVTKIGASCNLQPKHVNRSKMALVLDTSAILSGFAIHLSDTPQFTTPEVLSELRSDKIDSSTQLPLVNEASIHVSRPDEASMRRVDEVVDKVGEVSLSETDRSLIALALELKNKGYEPVLVTDDYALQNLADIMGLSFQPYVERGISHRYQWKLVCPGCFREYEFPTRMGTCSVCGTKLKKRIIASKKVRRC
jgi:UPF0271 protein